MGLLSESRWWRLAAVGVAFVIGYGGFRTGAAYLADDLNTFLRNNLGTIGSFVARQDVGLLALFAGLVGAGAMFLASRRTKSKGHRTEEDVAPDGLSPEPEPEPEPPEEKRRWSKRTPQELVAPYDNAIKTRFQADLEFEPHRGRWKKVHGIVQSIERKGGGIYIVDLKSESYGPVLVSCFFKSDDAEQILVDVNLSDAVTIEGQVDRGAQNHLMLDNCSLIEDQGK